MNTSNEIQELAAGKHSTVFESFVLVARDPLTYSTLRELNKGLPEESAAFFKSHAVIAAFLGQRRTGGYSVDIVRASDGRIRITEHAPPKNAMVTMVLTAPFKIAVVSVESDQALQLSLDPTWKDRLRPYQIMDGELSVSGGFAGRSEKFQLKGTIGVMRYKSLATFIFDVQTVASRPRHLQDAASGTVGTSGAVSLARVDSSALTGAIQSPFRATGQFDEDSRSFTLRLDTVASPHISDNFSATGSLKATATTPAPSDRAVAKWLMNQFTRSEVWI